MSKTPEEMAEEYTKDWWGNLPEAEGMRKSARENFLAGYQAAQQWISVKDRLPEIAPNRLVSDDVLWISTYGEMHVSCLEKLRSQLRIDWGEAGLLKLDQVTHWMPLPEAPKEEK